MVLFELHLCDGQINEGHKYATVVDTILVLIALFINNTVASDSPTSACLYFFLVILHVMNEILIGFIERSNSRHCKLQKNLITKTPQITKTNTHIHKPTNQKDFIMGTKQ